MEASREGEKGATGFAAWWKLGVYPGGGQVEVPLSHHTQWLCFRHTVISLGETGTELMRIPYGLCPFHRFTQSSIATGIPVT